MNWDHWSLKTRIVVPTVLLIVAIATTISLVSFLKSRAMLEETLKSHIDQVCDSTVVKVESWVEEQQQSVTLWALRPEAVSAVQDGENAAAIRKEVDSELKQAKQNYGFYEDLNLADKTGMTVASSTTALVGKIKVPDRQYFKDAMAGKVAISEVLASRVTGHPVVIIAAPVKADEAVCGVLYGVLDLDWFSGKFVSPIRLMQTGHAFLFDQRGVVIADPEQARILKTKIADFAWGRQMLEKHNGDIRYTFEGTNRRTTFRTAAALGWGVAVTVPARELNVPIYQMGWTNLVLSLCGSVLGVFLMLLTTRSIARPIQRAAKALSLGAEQTTSAAAQVSAASQSLAVGSSEQAASLEETSSSLEEMDSMTKRNADNAETAKGLANQTRLAADAGSNDMKEMSRAMEEIKGSSNNISRIIKTIDEIAFQTNILALNAAVEAARAGEAGAGFAVVADEVRSLAQRSAQAAKDTAERIEDSIRKSEQGVQLSGRVEHSLEEIVAKARKVDELVAEIAAASKEQSQGVSQLNVAVAQIDKVTQSNAANAEETASAAEELNAQAKFVREAVAQLRELVERSGSTTTPTLAPKPHRGSSPRSASADLERKPGAHDAAANSGYATISTASASRFTGGSANGQAQASDNGEFRNF